eukprot:gnl/TRDRNA2_/TRDRNA2_200436_c0_seq1.p1 gnl/TRDRNA2_/TRDRNA2_200436_c0~~gnl/TRDRNA2_/TRDRNA2_200436_c0_seq1.p1  ORF type:complete len:397 (+),score=91.01 gnl/TRDRNA2_/TRDRNA2_200436_c0_seq1:102-1292(+)
MPTLPGLLTEQLLRDASGSHALRGLKLVFLLNGWAFVMLISLAHFGRRRQGQHLAAVEPATALIASGFQAGVVREVASETDVKAICATHSGLTVLLLYAPWDPPSMHLAQVLDHAADEFKGVQFSKANTDACPGVATFLSVEHVPYAAFLSPAGKKIDSVEGADPPKLLEKVRLLAKKTFEEDDLTAKLERLIRSSPVMLFMKGAKENPFCKFSKATTAILNKYPEVQYSTFDIFQDNEVREGLKEYSKWPTYPQLYVNGELIGGFDIIKEMDEDGSLKELVNSLKKPASLEDRLKKLINKGQVTLFMKGTPETPRCGFSTKMIDILQRHSVKFETFDILTDEEVRQGLKTYSNWPTYPQLYAGGNFIGGLDIVSELDAEGTLMEELKNNMQSATI